MPNIASSLTSICNTLYIDAVGKKVETIHKNIELKRNGHACW